MMSDEIDLARPEVAAHYDELPLWSAPFGQLILERVPLRHGQSMLDVGSGTGFLTLELAQRCGPDSAVTAVDPWHEAMEILREKTRYLGLRNVAFHEADARSLDLADRSIDVVVSNLGINNFDDPDAVLHECRRVLHGDGSLLITSNLVGHMQEFYDIYRDTLSAFGRSDWLTALDREIAHRATPESTVTRLEHAGFTVTDVATSSFLMRYADGSALLAHYFIRLGFLPNWLSVVDDEHRRPVFADLEERLNRRAASAGSLDLTIPAACFSATPA